MAGELNRQDLLQIWGFLEMLSNILNNDTEAASEIENDEIRNDIILTNTNWLSEIRNLQQKLDKETETD